MKVFMIIPGDRILRLTSIESQPPNTELLIGRLLKLCRFILFSLSKDNQPFSLEIGNI